MIHDIDIKAQWDDETGAIRLYHKLYKEDKGTWSDWHHPNKVA